MKEIIVGQIIKDSWRPEWGTGVCIKETKEKWHIDFKTVGVKIYGREWFRFLVDGK